MKAFIQSIILFALSSPVFAAPPQPAPEPETLALIGIGIAAMLIGRIGKRK